MAVCYTSNANGKTYFLYKHVSNIFFNKTLAAFPVLNLKPMYLHLVSIDTGGLITTHPFSIFIQDMDPFSFFYFILCL